VNAAGRISRRVGGTHFHSLNLYRLLAAIKSYAQHILMKLVSNFVTVEVTGNFHCFYFSSTLRPLFRALSNEPNREEIKPNNSA
jgi:hypothetical protein